MPWIQTEPEIERRKFVQAVLAPRGPTERVVRALRDQSEDRYEMLQRHSEVGLPGHNDASRAPKTHPNQQPPEQEAAILRVRKASPLWGSKKIHWKLDRERPDDDWPARSTVDEILRRAGVVTEHGKRPRRQPTSTPRVEALAPNDVWSMDYKGCFRVGDGTLCDPLTIHDVHSRASLVCQAMVQPKSNDVRRRLEEAFGAFGLPKYMLRLGGRRLRRVAARVGVRRRPRPVGLSKHGRT